MSISRSRGICSPQAVGPSDGQAVRPQRELSEATRQTGLTEKTERRNRGRRGMQRRTANAGPPAGVPHRRSRERRKGERRSRK